MSDEKVIRDHLVNLLTSRQAHVGFKRVLDQLPEELQATKPEGAAHTPWQLLEHLRIDGGAGEDRGEVNVPSDVVVSLEDGFESGAFVHAVDMLEGGSPSYSASLTKSPTSLVV